MLQTGLHRPWGSLGGGRPLECLAGRLVERKEKRAKKRGGDWQGGENRKRCAAKIIVQCHVVAPLRRRRGGAFYYYPWTGLCRFHECYMERDFG